MKLFFSLALIGLVASHVYGASSPSFSSFNTDQFGVSNQRVVVKSGALLTNATLVGTTTADTLSITSLSVTNPIPSTVITNNLRLSTVGFTADGGGSAIATGKVKGFFTCPYPATITGWNIVADAGTCTVKVWKIAPGTAKPTIANVINTSGVSLASGTAIHSSTVTDFTTTAVAANDIFAFDITAVASATEITFNLELLRL